MHVDVTGIVAVSCFGACFIAMALKKPLTALAAKNKTKSEEVEALRHKVEQLEGLVTAVHQNMIELKESSDFTHQLLAQKQTGEQGHVISTKSEKVPSPPG